MKYLLIIFTLFPLSFCSSVKQEEAPKVPEYQAELKIQQVVFYGDTIVFDAPISLTPTPNSNKITLINLGNGIRFGVKYFLDPSMAGEKNQLTHNAVFYEEVFDQWESFNQLDHREPALLGEEKYWGIKVSNDEGTYFLVDFTYLVTES